jgi:L-ascorbate metabolism protein UlaG (beta-lactamase superfamily)
VEGLNKFYCTEIKILTHGHGDHFGDVVELANRNHATVIGSAEVQGYLGIPSSLV